MKGKARLVTCITGTPGTGKSTVGKLLARRGLFVVEIGDLCRRHGIYSYIENGETLVIDEGQLSEFLSRYLRGVEEAIVVGHLSHHYPEPTSVVVLRTRPDVLEERLRSKGWPRRKIKENVEAEALDIILAEALEMHREKVSEIDTTALSPGEVCERVVEIHRLGRRYPPKVRDWLLAHILKDLNGR